MVVIHELAAIREMIRKPCNIVWKVPFIVADYNDVLSEWLRYRDSNTLHSSIADSRLLKEIFTFHSHIRNHIVLYKSRNLNDCLLMCRIDGKYINIVAPVEGSDVLTNESLVATYT